MEDEELIESINTEIASLKGQLELIELLESPSKNQTGLLLEHLVKKFVNVKVKMYQESHGIPHIHLDIGNENHKTSISINNQEILAGSIDKKYKEPVLEWIKKNEDKLITLWNTIQEGQIINLPKIA